MCLDPRSVDFASSVRSEGLENGLFRLGFTFKHLARYAGIVSSRLLLESCHPIIRISSDIDTTSLTLLGLCGHHRPAIIGGNEPGRLAELPGPKSLETHPSTPKPCLLPR